MRFDRLTGMSRYTPEHLSVGDWRWDQPLSLCDVYTGMPPHHAVILDDGS